MSGALSGHGMHTNFWSEHLSGLDVDGRITLKRILRKQFMKLRTGFHWARLGASEP
jgi:hypothetical protein